jgi:hypothetical protein
MPLYVAKRAGRNRVELLGPDDAGPLAEVEAVENRTTQAFRRSRRPLHGQAKSLTSG